MRPLSLKSAEGIIVPYAEGGVKSLLQPIVKFLRVGKRSLREKTSGAASPYEYRLRRFSR